MSDTLLEQLDEEHRDLLRACGRAAAGRGEHAYLVGGSVRDLLLERRHDDIDIVVEGDGLAVAQEVSRGVDGELTRHHAFQTATVTTPAGVRVDIATARSEEYPRPGQLPRVVSGTLDQDLERRDFTINTMAISVDRDDWGRFIDPLGGRADLQSGLVRVMHSRSFADDPTRILRALRFALRFAYELEEDTQRSLREAVAGGYLQDVSADRVRREVRLTLGESPVKGPLRLQQEGVLEGIHPRLRADEGELRRLRELQDWYAGLPEVAGDPSKRKARGWTLVLTCCAAGLPQQDRWEVVRDLRLSREERAPLIDAGAPWRRAREALEAAGEDGKEPAASTVERALRGLAPGALLVVAAGEESHGNAAAAIRRYLAELRGVRPTLNGADLQSLGVPPGPEIGRFLEKLRAARLDGEVSSAAGERRLVRDWLAAEPC